MKETSSITSTVKDEEREDSVGMDAFAILVVDDDPIVRRILKELLQEQCYRFEEAKSGEQALEKVAQGAFDLIILDCYMPGITGFDTSRILRERGCLIPIVALTIETRFGILEECTNAGMDHYLQKPLDRDALFEVLRQHVGSEHEALA